MTTFIYCLRCPETGDVRYIGKTTKPKADNRWTPEKRAEQGERIKNRGPEYQELMRQRTTAAWVRRKAAKKESG